MLYIGYLHWIVVGERGTLTGMRNKKEWRGGQGSGEK